MAGHARLAATVDYSSKVLYILSGVHQERKLIYNEKAGEVASHIAT